jgi:hypothetical protein
MFIRGPGGGATGDLGIANLKHRFYVSLEEDEKVEASRTDRDLKAQSSAKENRKWSWTYFGISGMADFGRSGIGT